MWTYDRNGLLRRQTALADGVPAREFDEAVAQNELVRVARGVYIDAGRLKDEPAWRQRQIKYGSRCLAAAGRDTQERLLSHDSAAVVHELDTLDPENELVHFTNEKTSGGGVAKRLTVIHAGQVPDGDIAVINGIKVTGLARTVVDVALAARTFEKRLAVLDSGLRRGLDPDELKERLAVRRKGVGYARYALRYADGLAANPGESWCRAQIIEAGLPVPVLQRRYRLRDGSVAYVDHDFDGRVVLEFDGEVKYSSTYLRSGETPSDVLIAEKRREDGLRELGLDVVRASWSDLRENAMIPMLSDHLAARGLGPSTTV